MDSLWRRGKKDKQESDDGEEGGGGEEEEDEEGGEGGNCDGDGGKGTMATVYRWYIDFLTLKKKETAKCRLLFRITCNFFEEGE